MNRETAYATLPRYGNYIPNRVISGVTLTTQGWVRKPAPITVTSPDGFEIWQGVFSTKTIQWSYIGYVGSTVKIELLKGTTAIPVTAINVPIGSNGRGSYSKMMVLAPGSDYRARVTTNYGYSDTSNSYFTVR